MVRVIAFLVGLVFAGVLLISMISNAAFVRSNVKSYGCAGTRNSPGMTSCGCIRRG